MKYSSLYGVIEACIAQAIPLWNRTLSSIKEPGNQRIEMEFTEYIFPQTQVELPVEDDNYAGETTSDGSESEDDSQRPTRVLVQPEPKEYEYIDKPVSVDLRKQFQESGLQVITKLANIGQYSSSPFILRTQSLVASIIQGCPTMQLVFESQSIASKMDAKPATPFRAFAREARLRRWVVARRRANERADLCQCTVLLRL